MNAKIHSAPKLRGRFPTLDALRAVLALWVAIDHLGPFPLFAGVDPATWIGQVLTKGWLSVIWGVPAVIGFFVISGFCIHLPFRGEEKLLVGRYYARRYTRILIPVAAAILINQASGDHVVVFGPGSFFWKSVLWSLFCEELYYAVYPAARLVRMRFGWRVLLVPTFLVGLLTALKYPNCLDGTVLGVCKAAVILFPIWLLGCVLAEHSDRLPASNSAPTMWRWRFYVWFASWVAYMLHYVAHVSLELAMLGFGVVAFYWIRQEIAYSAENKPYSVLAWAGAWSYSLYLMHAPAGAILARLHLPNFGYILNWFILIGSALAVAHVFYLLIERPSHRLARKIRVTPEGAKAASGDLLAAEADSPGALA